MDLLIVGLDGLSFNMTAEFEVETNYIEETRSEGISGPLWSVDTPTTLPAWTSFATGKDPGSHGLTNMLQQDREYNIGPSTPNHTDAAIYDLLDDAVFINLPATVSREPAGDALLVSSFLASDAAEAVPTELQSLEEYRDYVINADTSLKSNPQAYVEHICEIIDARSRFAQTAFDRYEPQVGFVLFSAPDWIGHHLALADDQSQQAEWYRRVVEMVDEKTAELGSLADNVLLLSDHGFERKPKTIHLQNWLRDRGYLRIQEEDVTTIQQFASTVARVLVNNFRPAFEVARDIYQRLNHGTEGGGIETLVNFNPEVDFNCSTAWQLRYGCLYLNDDRFVSPTVGDAEEVRRELRDEVAALTDENGAQIFKHVALSEEIYDHPGEMTPDIIARPAEGYLPLRAFSPTDSYIKTEPETPKYDHRYEGVLAAKGPLFDTSASVENVSILDIFPTILHALGEPLLPDFDGRAQLELLSTHEDPRTRNAAQVPTPRTRRTETERKETVEKRLADMGYLE